MMRWKRQKKPPEGDADALLLERLVPRVTIAHITVPPLESELAAKRRAEQEQQQVQAQVSQQALDVDDAMEVSKIINQYA